jgi:hypothetical protein
MYARYRQAGRWDGLAVMHCDCCNSAELQQIGLRGQSLLAA